MTGNNIFLLDSNILIYNYDDADPIKHQAAKYLIDRCWDGKEKLALSTQNLSEFFSVTTAKKFLSKRDATKVISDIIEFSGWIKLDFDHKTTFEAAKISDENNMSYWDSLLAATMRQNGIFNLYTENTRDFKGPWINATNPFVTDADKKLAKIRSIKIGNIKKSRGIAKGVTTEDLRDETERFE